MVAGSQTKSNKSNDESSSESDSGTDSDSSDGKSSAGSNMTDESKSEKVKSSVTKRSSILKNSNSVAKESTRPEYNMNQARLSVGCNAVLFPEQSSSSCEKTDNLTEFLTSALKNKQKTSEISSKLTKPLNKKPMFPGLKEALEKRKKAAKAAGTKRAAKKADQVSLQVPEIPQIKFKDFYTTPLKFSPIIGRTYALSDAWLYDSYAHVLASTSAKRLSYFEDPDLGLEAGLPLRVDARTNLKYLIGEIERTTSIKPGSDLLEEVRAQEFHRDSAHPMFDLSPLTLGTHGGGRADSILGIDGDISTGIVGARFFERSKRESIFAADKAKEACCAKEAVKEYRRSRMPLVAQCKDRNRKEGQTSKISKSAGNRRRHYSSDRHRSRHSKSGARADVEAIVMCTRRSSHCKRHSRGSILDEPYLSLLRRADRSGAMRRTKDRLSIY